MLDSEAKIKWQKENMWMICIKIHRKADADIVAFLESKGADKQKTIKTALRRLMDEEDA